MNELETRKKEELINAFNLSNEFVEKQYLNELTNYDIVPLNNEINSFSIRNNIRLFKISKLTYDKNENVLDKLSTVFQALGSLNSSLVFVIDSDGTTINLYIGTRTQESSTLVNPSKELLEKSFKGNFPGSEITNIKNSEIENLIESIFSNQLSENNRVISTVSGIPSLKNEDQNSFVQGIEKLIDAMIGERFSAVFIADALQQNNINQIKLGYERLYSQLVPFKETDLSYSSIDNHAITESISKGLTETVTESLTDTQSHTMSKGQNVSKSTNSSKTKGIGFTFGVNFNNSTTKGFSDTEGRSYTQSETEGISNTKGSSDSKSETESESETYSSGKSQTMQIKFENKSVTNLLNKIDDQLIRLQSSEDFGLWNTACYFIADESHVSQIAASTYKALLRGENSSVEQSHVNTWRNSDNPKSLELVKNYLEKLHHPLIKLKVENGLDLPNVTPASLINGKELALQFGLPRKSVTGIPVIETAEFGRNVFSYDNSDGRSSINLGSIFHMGNVEKTPVRLDLESLSMHTFITGSTGSGKSNTIYTILNELLKKNISFLVIEPAKGEYKEVFGGKNGVHVLGTNPKHTPLLKINPLKFPLSIHVLEHIDRVIEIFNACWPMYAAMPAVLKEAIERTYERKGWDLETSTHLGLNLEFPTMRDLVKTLPEVIQESAYSDELKSNYTGALVTRVRSLTNGLLGHIFSGVEVDNSILFDSNCIVDLSRIGSTETKSLLMGILFMRLQEHRISDSKGLNQKIKHVTILEEAHHLLRRTSMSQSQEGSNLQGKSVEMITNAIAEMRTYGEGFIIADQSPNLLDVSVIRNTNTKIILRLPEGTDRNDVGQSASLTEDQINEIPKLKSGVAVVFQNNWLQPVLCAVDKYNWASPYEYNYDEIDSLKNGKKNRTQIINMLLAFRVSEENSLKNSISDIDGLVSWLSDENIDSVVKDRIITELKNYKSKGVMKVWEDSAFDTISTMVSELINGKRIVSFAREAMDFEQYNSLFQTIIDNYLINDISRAIKNEIQHSLLHYHALENPGFKDYYFNWVDSKRNGEKIL
jgi:hypothetical protein